MTAIPNKICPKCGQRMVLTMRRCGRCGYLFSWLDRLLEWDQRESAKSKDKFKADVRKHPYAYALGLILILCFIFSGPSHNQFEYSAALAAEKQVKFLLTDPDSATFNEEHMTHMQQSPNDVFVWGFVDAKNAFGGTMRHKWRCKVHRIEGEWQADLPEIDN